MPATPHLVDTTLFFSPTSGGVRRYLLEKSAWLSRHSTVTHTLLVPGARDRGSAGGLVEFASPRIPGGAGYRCPWRLRKLGRRLRALAPDLIEAGDPYQMGWQAAAAAEALGIPAVAFCHSDLIRLFAERFGRWTHPVSEAYLRAVYARFALVIAPSRVVASHLDAARVSDVVVQPLGVDVASFSPERADARLRSRLALPRGTRLLVFAGRLAPEKNVADLYALAERLGAPFHIVILGGERKQRVGRHATLLPYEKNPARLAAWLASADAFVHAGRCETFGLIVLEALACGTPVVVYDAGALPELVRPEFGVVARDGGPGALADAVNELFSRDHAALRRAARAHVLAEHSWDRVFRRELRLYEALLARASLLKTDEPGYTAA
jgi:alpha-1,6-mannosyltransferase